MFINLCVSYLLSYSLMKGADRLQNTIRMKYINEEEYIDLINNQEEFYNIQLSEVAQYKMSDWDYFITQVCDFLITYSIFVTAAIGSAIAVFVFYKVKIKPPLLQLEQATWKISQNQLDFKLINQNKDEMGALCRQFERMRSQLEKNNKSMWKMAEQEKALRAAIAHDIRSPLTILQGYLEMLLEFIPQNSLDTEKVMEMLQAGMNQTERLTLFINTMGQLSGLEEREIHYQKIDLDAFVKQITDNMKVLVSSSDKECLVHDMTLPSETGLECNQEEKKGVYFDPEIVLEVVENLVNNAIRYTKTRIDITLTIKDGEFRISVQDDGAGFSEDYNKITRAYYHNNPQDDLKHFGLGLYVCRVYCEKHGGKLLLSNQKQGGADAVAVFKIKSEIG